MHHLEGNSIDAFLIVLGLGVDNDLNVALLALRTDFVQCIQHLLWWQVSLNKSFDDRRPSSRSSTAMLVGGYITLYW